MRCDECKGIIEGMVVDIGEYGVRFHERCFRAMTGPEMLLHLGIDEALLYDTLSPAGTPQIRLRDPRRSTGEAVYWR